MPKIQINHPREVKTYSGGSPDEPTTCETHMDPILNVNWHNAGEMPGHVQLSLDVSTRELNGAVQNSNGRMVIGSSLIYTPVLERKEVNELIRALRRARDGAYGADA